jgi:SAM-dependent methyltransferase
MGLRDQFVAPAGRRDRPLSSTRRSDSAALTRVCRAAFTGRLPQRYEEFWREEFDATVRGALHPGIRVLDVGSGRRPTVPADQRPPGCLYVGLDLSAAELADAPPGSYHETYTSDVGVFVPALEERFDLVLSFQVLEHVAPLELAMDNMRRYLRPGGRMLVHFSGAFSAFGLLNRVVPQAVTPWLLHRLLGRDPRNVFPPRYDKCWYEALEPIMRPWNSATITPRWRGASYFRFSRFLRAVYVTYEEWARTGQHRNLAPYYLVDATR